MHQRFHWARILAFVTGLVNQQLLLRNEYHYNNVHLNGATGYITSKDMLAGRQQEIHAERDRKLEEARKMRKDRRQQAA
jgi:hypothetical protein